ncbi:MAG: exodeoxyribonuclease [Actinomycetota bacterium]|nr:exodeoxyribonuclease [Actinomycetota bacterium]
MKVITWNVNSIRQRLPRVLALLARHQPDVVCLQETKVADDGFPLLELSGAGYHAVTFGQRAYNGVAIFARQEPTDVMRGFRGDPTHEASRVIACRVGDLAVVNVYVVNGKMVGDPAYDVKLAWLDAFDAWIRDTYDPSEPLLIVGDFNVTPDDRDVYAPEAWRGKNLASPAERERIANLRSWGLTDLSRAFSGDVEGPFTFWDYRVGAFHRGWGLRIDLALGTGPVANRLLDVAVDREERKDSTGEGKPSDHAPLIVTLRD